MKNKLSKTETEKKIKEFFFDIKSKNSKQIKKIKRLAMSKNIALKDYRRLFCKKCLTPYISPKIRIKNNQKIVFCENCGNISRFRI